MASEYGDLEQHWWNQQWGWARKDIWVHRQGGRWHILWCSRLDHDDMFKRLNTSETVANAYVARLIAIAPEPPAREDWRDIAGAHRQYR